MNYRPYPDVDRALAQVKRGRLPAPLVTTIHVDATALEAAFSRFRQAFQGGRQAGKATVTAAIFDQAVKTSDPARAATSTRATPKAADEPAVTMHAVPLPGSNGISACCGRPPCEFVGEHVTRDPDKVTCTGPAAGARQDGAQR